MVCDRIGAGSGGMGKRIPLARGIAAIRHGQTTFAHAIPPKLSHPLHAIGIACLMVAGGLIGCASPQNATLHSGDRLAQAMEEHRRAFGEFDLPRKIGTVANLGVQLPQIAPDGIRMLYLRTDRESVSPMTILGSTDPNASPAEGTLSIWLRPVNGTSFGQRISRQHWAHSPTWSPSGKYVAYVAANTSDNSLNTPDTIIVRINLATGKEDVLAGVRGVNILPMFDRNDDTLLFCHCDNADGPLEVCRQAVNDERATVMTPRGTDCLFPIVSNGLNKAICGRIESGQLDWAECTAQSTNPIAPPCGTGERPAVLQTWAGISSPVSPDWGGFLFYDSGRDRITACRWADRAVHRHRPGSIAACWLTNDAIALATAEGLFAVNARTGASISLLTGSWIPLRYVPSTTTLYLLGKEHGVANLAINQLCFRPRQQG